MTAHSLLGASGAHRWLNCPGSFRLSQTAPHRPTTIWAATGTLAHELIERQVIKKRFQPLDPAKEEGRFRRVDGHDITVDRDFIDGVNVMLDYLREEVHGHDWWHVEHRVSLDGCFKKTNPPPVPMFGTVDAMAWDRRDSDLEIIDYKNGSRQVSPVENPQLLFYAVGAYLVLPFDYVRHIKLTIVQPHAGNNPVRSWVITPVDLLMWLDEVLRPGIYACAEPDAPLVPGSWCHFCPVSHACPALQKDAVAMAQREFDDIPDEPTELSQALDMAERASLWILRLREFAQDQLQRQVRIPGWGLVPTRATRKWTKDDTSIGDWLLEAGIGASDVWETRLRSPAQLEKVLHRSRIGRGIWNDAVAGRLIEARSSGVKVGRTTDPKEDFTDES